MQQVQRQLQLRIEAQGKYLKKIIEEQQRLSGVLSEAPGSSGQASDDPPESENKTDPATPAPTSESQLLDKIAKELTPAKSHSIDESFSSHHEPSTPDSGCHIGSPIESPNGERSLKKQRVSLGGPYPKMLLTNQILESSLKSSFQQPHSIFLTRELYKSSSKVTVGNEDQLKKVTGSNP